MSHLIAKLVLVCGIFLLLMAALFGLRVGASLLIWTGVALCLGYLFILAMRKIRGRDHWAMHMAQQEGFPEQAGPWPDPHQDADGDFPNTKPIRAVGDRDNG